MSTSTLELLDTDALTELLTVPQPRPRPQPQPQPQPQEQWLWHHRWSATPVPIRGPEHLAVLLTTLDPDRDFAGITAESTGRWAQTKRVDSGWWAEGGDPALEWPWVFVPEGWTRPRELDRFACWSHAQAAELLWAWFDGRLPDGVVILPAPGGNHG
ncbi:hypothetical protein [Janibacter anophelis]|uniref:hypothetical protein n=1 Tax=Janibacter anophelis TaxID=319054 RepID=UPI000DEEDDFE|nr:hypothetical protein [Janibacter anophelis]